MTEFKKGDRIIVIDWRKLGSNGCKEYDGGRGRVLNNDHRIGDGCGNLFVEWDMPGYDHPQVWIHQDGVGHFPLRIPSPPWAPRKRVLSTDLSTPNLDTAHKKRLTRRILSL